MRAAVVTVSDGVAAGEREDQSGTLLVESDDAPAARVNGEDRSLPALVSLGFLIGPVDSHPRTRAFSPRSPRGPPAAV